jgi:hypothetical protein
MKTHYIFPSLRREKQVHSRAWFFCVSLILIVSLVSSFFPAVANATTGVPKIINFQGRLLDSSGNLLGGSGTNYCFKFSLYDAASGGTKLWPTGSPSNMTLNVKTGVFNANIGSGADTLDFDFQSNNSAYVDVQVAAQVASSCVGVTYETLTPRQQVVSAGYAINSGTVGGFTPAQSASGSQIPVLTSDTLILGGTTAGLKTTSTNALTFQSGTTGDIQFFSGSNKITSAGALTIAGSGTMVGLVNTGTSSNTVQSTTALTVARTGTNYALQVDTNTASSVTGLKITSAAAGAGLALAALSTATDEALTLDAKGAGTVSIAGTSTGDILLGGGSGSTGCTITNSTGALACTAGISGGAGSFTTLTSTSNTTLATGASTTNTFGSGASSINTIGSSTTPGALTLHGATTLDNTFTVSGSNLTSLGGNLTVTGTAWTATPTISGLITATSGLTSNGTVSIVSGNTTGITTAAGLNLSVNSLTTGTGFYAGSNSATSGKLVDLQISSNASLTGQTALNIVTAGTNSTGGQTTYGIQVGNNHTGTSTNVAGYFSSTGGSNNYALVVPNGGGNVGIGDTAPAALFTVGSSSVFQVNSSGAIAAATGITSSGTINFSGLTASSAVYTDGSKNLTSTAPTSGALGYWSRTGTTVSPTTITDEINIGNATDQGAYTLQNTGGFYQNGLVALTGTAQINSSGTSATSIGNSSSALTLASGTASGWTNTSGTLTIQTVTSGNTVIDSAGVLQLGITNSTGTSLGKAATTLTVNPTAWTATPTISGLITATSGLTSNGTLTVGANQNLTMSSGTGVVTQTFTGTTTNGHLITANSLTTGTGLSITSSSTANTSTKGLLYVQNSTATTTGTLARFEANSGSGSGLTVLANGQVGIGTTTPDSTATLEIRNNAPDVAPQLILSNADTGNSYAQLQLKGSGNAWSFGVGNNTETFFNLPNDYFNYDVVRDQIRFVIKHGTGYVGIGTTTPSAALEVAQSDPAAGSSTVSQPTFKGFVYTGRVNTGQTASTEIPAVTFTTAGRQWNTGALTTQREVLITQPTYSFVGASTITDAATVGIVGAPIKSTNATITNTHGLLIQAGAVSTATNSYGLTVNAQTGATNNYAAQFLGGNVGIGNSAPTSLFSVGSSSQFQVNSSGAIAAATGITSSGTITFSGITAASGTECLQVNTSGVVSKTGSACGSGGGGVTTVGAFSGSSQTNGANITGTTITFGPADTTNPGMVTASGSQTFGGQKLFSNATTTGADLGITNTGVYTGTGIFNLTGNSATTGTLASITGNALTTGSAQKIAFTQNSGAAAGNTANGLSIVAATNTNSGNTADLINLASSGATGTVNGIEFTGTAGNFTNFIKTPSFVLSSAGAITGATGVGTTTVTASGQITSTVTTGTAPFVVASTTNVANLNASSLNGATFASPGSIGSTTAGTGAFTTLTSSGNTTLATDASTTNTFGSGASSVNTIGSGTTPGALTLNGAITASSLAGSGVRCLQTDNTGAVTVAAAACGSGGGSSAWDTLTVPTTSNLSLAHGAFTTTFSFNSLAGASAFKLSSTSTAAASNAQKMFEIALSGTNSTSTQTTYGAYISNTHGGTGAVNVGLYATASGGTTNSNYAGIFDSGRVLIGLTSETVSASKLYIQATNSDSSGGATAAVAGVHENLTFSPSGGGTQVGNRMVISNAPTTSANTSIGEIIRTTDNTTLANTVRGLEIVSSVGTNTAGTNTGLRATGATFGVQGITTGLAGGVSGPAALYGEMQGTTQGDALRLYSNTITSAPQMAYFYHDTTTFSGNGITMDFATGSGSFTGNFVDFQNNNVSKFKVTSAGDISADLAVSTNGFALCHETNGAGVDQIKDCGAAPTADYAEMYPVATDVDYGDIVVTGTDMVNTYDTNASGGGVDWTKVKGQITRLIKSTKAYQGTVIGIVSQNNGDFTSAGHNIKDEDRPMPIALNGRVPVKVASSSPIIMPGDYVTTSADEPGKAMKAIKSGQVIGKALEMWTPGSGKATVMIYVEQGFYNGVGVSQFAGIDAATPDFANQVLSYLMSNAQASANGATDLVVDRIAAGLEIITPHLVSDSIKTNTLTTTGESHFDGLTFFGGATTFTNSTVFSAPVEFTLPPLFNKDTAGFAIIHQGDKKVRIDFDQPYATTPVVTSTMTFEATDNIDDTSAADLFNANIQYIVTGKDQTGFTIIINKAAPQNIRFSWVALGVRDAKVVESVYEGLTLDQPPVTDPAPQVNPPTDPSTGDTTTPPVTDTPVVPSDGGTAPVGDTPSSDTGSTF